MAPLADAAAPFDWKRLSSTTNRGELYLFKLLLWLDSQGALTSAHGGPRPVMVAMHRAGCSVLEEKDLSIRRLEFNLYIWKRTGTKKPT